MKNIKKFLKIKYILILIVLVIAGLTVYNIKFKEKTITGKVVNLETQKIVKTVSASGGVGSNNIANLSFGATSKVVSLNVNEGDLVDQGQLLATGDSSAQWQSSESAKFLKEQAIIDRNTFIDQYADDLEAIGGRNEYERQLRKKNEIVNQYDANYKSSLANLTGYRIYAPIMGTVVNVDKKVGEISPIGTNVLVIADLNNLYFEALVDQEDIGVLKQDQKAKVRFDSYPDTEFDATVLQVPNYISSGSENIKVKLLVEPKENQPVLYGMAGDVEIIVDSSESTTALPFQYVITDENGKEYVWVVNTEGYLEKQMVEVNLEGDLYYDIKTDLSDKKIVFFEDSKLTPIPGVKVILAE